jgi:predicted 3-demethylubiquinone-9 3-methyltransferase (glyoxalase superfamily)
LPPTASIDTRRDVKPIVPCIWFDDQAEQAADLYVRSFREARVTAVSHYPMSSDNPSGKPRGSVLTVEIEIHGQRFTALNGGPMFVPNPSISFFVNVDTHEEADGLFAKLADGGEALMSIGAYPWSERYGWVKDSFGVSWQIMAGRRQGSAVIVPCLMFSGAQHKKAEEAMKAYAAIFPEGRIDAVQHYEADEGPKGTVKHGRFLLDGQLMVAMDSHVSHGVTFNEAISLQVMCADQAEIDRYWEALSEGGEKGPCGWLKDRFGLSWQVVPASIAQFMASTDVAARDRAFRAVMKMKKLDIFAIQRAYDGK